MGSFPKKPKLIREVCEYSLIRIWEADVPHPSRPPQLLRVDLTSREGISFQIKRGVFEYRLIRIWEANFPHHSSEILESQKYTFANHKLLVIPNVLSVGFTVYTFHIYFQLIVFKLTPSEAKTFKHTVKCKLNDADKFTQV